MHIQTIWKGLQNRTQLLLMTSLLPWFLQPKLVRMLSTRSAAACHRIGDDVLVGLECCLQNGTCGITWEWQLQGISLHPLYSCILPAAAACLPGLLPPLCICKHLLCKVQPFHLLSKLPPFCKHSRHALIALLSSVYVVI